MVKEIVFIVAGKSKSAAVKEVLEGKFQPEIFPAQIIKPVEGSITWLLQNLLRWHHLEYIKDRQQWHLHSHPRCRYMSTFLQ